MSQQNKTINIPLFWKFTFISTITVFLFGIISIYFLWSSVYTSFEKEIDKRCIVLSRIVSEKVLTPMVYDDVLSIYNILDEIKQSDPSISYIFILSNSNQLIAHTYGVNINPSLLKANSLNSNNLNIEVLETYNYKYPIVRDIAYPILNGEVGTVRLGIVEEHIQQELKDATKDLIIMIAVFFIVGLLGALVFSSMITLPIKKISQRAQIIDLDQIDSSKNMIDRKRRKIFSIQINDELDILVTKFSEMLERLENSYLELKETQDALVQAEKLASLGTLSAGVAHEINNPISGIKNCTNRIIKHPENTERNSQYILLIKEATDKIENVVQHLLNFSRKQNFIFEKVVLNNIIDNAIKLTSHKIENRSIEIKAIYSDDFYVNASSNHLEQVFVNLILNSLDAILERKDKEPGLEGKIEMDISRNKDKVIAHFRDNGMGIPLEIQNKIYDPFFTSKKVGKGTGLGLSVSFNIIKEHKGGIRFISSIAKGTEFIIELPCYTKE